MRLLGLDPGLQRTGWGVIEFDRGRLCHVADGVIATNASLSLAERLVQLANALTLVLLQQQPCEAAVEETFVNRNAFSTLRLGQARGIALLVPAQAGLPVSEYPPNQVKKAVVGVGHAAKEQVQMMVRTLLPGARFTSADAADALAVAICHAHHRDAAARTRMRAAQGSGH